jgi:hypothetical protein
MIAILFPISNVPEMAYESLNATEVAEGLYKIENIPFYTSQVSRHDIVKVVLLTGQFHFLSLDSLGGHSTFVFSFYKSMMNIQAFLDYVTALNLKYEIGLDRGAVAIDIAPSQSADVFYSGFDALLLPKEAFCLTPLCIQH